MVRCAHQNDHINSCEVKDWKVETGGPLGISLELDRDGDGSGRGRDRGQVQVINRFPVPGDCCMCCKPLYLCRSSLFSSGSLSCALLDPRSPHLFSSSILLGGLSGNGSLSELQPGHKQPWSKSVQNPELLGLEQSPPWIPLGLG